ncbi:unnamed protein product [Closterium sp. NIES-65]|nr:unnamed protein product [Closterium sp. NIES-65]
MLEDNFLNNSARTVYSNVLMPGETICGAVNMVSGPFDGSCCSDQRRCMAAGPFDGSCAAIRYAALRLLFSLAKLLPPPSVHNSFSGGGASVGGKSPSSSFPLSLTPSSLSLQYAPSPASSQAPPEPVPPAEVQNGSVVVAVTCFAVGWKDRVMRMVLQRHPAEKVSRVDRVPYCSTSVVSSRCSSNLVGVGTLLYPPDSKPLPPFPPTSSPSPIHQPTLLKRESLPLAAHTTWWGWARCYLNLRTTSPIRTSSPPMLMPDDTTPAHQPILLKREPFPLAAHPSCGSGHGAGPIRCLPPLPGGCGRHLRCEGVRERVREGVRGWAASQVGGISGVAMGFASKEMVASFFGGLVLVFSQPFVVGEMAKVTATHTAWPTLFLSFQAPSTALPNPLPPPPQMLGVAMGFASKKIVANFFGGLVLVISQPFVVGERIQAGAISGRVEEDGVAMGFASKEIVANFFGGLVLVISQPFVVGERIQAGAISGRVEEIGFLHTKLAGANKAPVVVPNQIFNTAVSAPITTVTFELRIEDIERVQAITSRITRMLRSHADVDQSQGPAHAVLKDLNGASLHVGMLASLNPQEGRKVVDVKQEILERAVRIILDEGACIGTNVQFLDSGANSS